jgi:RNA polymerase sigma factor (sigma-70 family)
MPHDISALYHLHCQEILHHLQRIVKCPDTAEDLLQESYLILARTAADTTIDYPRGFLYRTASNLAFDHLRHHKVVQQHFENAQLATQPQQESAETQLDQDQWHNLLYETIAELPPRCRDVFILHKLRGLSYREIAKMLDVSESAVEKHIIKGLLHCRQRLGKHFSQPYQTN